jgi:hypothetical protein
MPKQPCCELCKHGFLEEFLVPEKLRILKCPKCGLYQKGLSLLGVDHDNLNGTDGGLSS